MCVSNVFCCNNTKWFLVAIQKSSCQKLLKLHRDILLNTFKMHFSPQSVFPTSRAPSKMIIIVMFSPAHSTWHCKWWWWGGWWWWWWWWLVNSRQNCKMWNHLDQPYIHLPTFFNLRTGILWEKSQICLKNICAFQITFFFLKFISVLFKSLFLLLQICICALIQITFFFFKFVSVLFKLLFAS